jgi:hypothetical protein
MLEVCVLLMLARKEIGVPKDIIKIICDLILKPPERIDCLVWDYGSHPHCAKKFHNSGFTISIRIELVKPQVIEGIVVIEPKQYYDFSKIEEYFVGAPIIKNRHIIGRVVNIYRNKAQNYCFKGVIWKYLKKDYRYAVTYSRSPAFIEIYRYESRSMITNIE